MPPSSRAPERLIALRGNVWLARGAGVAGVVAAGAMLVALFLPFVRQDCAGCSASYVSWLPVGRLVVSPDAGVLIWIAALVAVTSVGRLLDIGVRWTALAGVCLALAALALAIFEGVAAFPRVLSVATLPLGMTSLPVSYGLESGYYLFLGGAVLAVVAGAMMLVARPGVASVLSPRLLESPRTAVTLGWACVAALAVAFAGLFAPFAQLACYYGCPAGVVHPGSYSGSVIGGPGGWTILAALAAAALATSRWLASHRTSQGSALGALVLGLVLQVLISFQMANAATLVLGWPFSIPTSRGLGSALLLGGSGAAVLLALLMLTCTYRLQAKAGEARARSVATVRPP
ncbi:MAG: hypothetical protein ABR950_01430 [Candidatus Dormibacteria bacterium]